MIYTPADKRRDQALATDEEDFKDDQENGEDLKDIPDYVSTLAYTDSNYDRRYMAEEDEDEVLCY